ncbi:plasmid stabilization protein [Paracoccus litorisediminis]|uniref:FitA-like ribbon-helix-helix domain-containing protein n=1 Tax=Paracoccus litorisediminis TaxID=2006130 RepID=UPI00372E5B7B
MANITIRNLDDAVKQGLRLRAALHGRSMEDEVRHILRIAVGRSPTPNNLGSAIHARFAALGGIDLDLPKRDAMRPLPDFE